MVTDPLGLNYGPPQEGSHLFEELNYWPVRVGLLMFRN